MANTLLTLVMLGLCGARIAYGAGSSDVFERLIKGKRVEDVQIMGAKLDEATKVYFRELERSLPEDRDQFMWRIKRAFGPRANEFFLAVARSERETEELRESAVMNFSGISTTSAIEQVGFRDLISDKKIPSSIRMKGAYLLASAGKPFERAVVMEALKMKENPTGRLWASKTIEEYGTHEDLPSLQPLLTSGPYFVRVDASKSYFGVLLRTEYSGRPGQLFKKIAEGTELPEVVDWATIKILGKISKTERKKIVEELLSNKGLNAQISARLRSRLSGL